MVHVHSEFEYDSNVYVCWMRAPYNYGYCIIKDTSVSMVILANIDVIVCLILTKKLISIITLQLSGDVLGRGLTTGPASNGLLSYYPEYISFGLAGIAENHNMCIKYFIKHLQEIFEVNGYLP